MADKPNIHKLITANREFTDKMQKAIKDSYDAFQKVVKPGVNFDRQGAQNPLVDGSLKAWISLLNGSVEAWASASKKFLK
jgi:hypothetical protein